MVKFFSWGCTANGRCGHGESNVSSSAARSGYSIPKRVDALRKVVIKQVCAGDSHSLALSGGGRVFSWGNNNSGELGMGHTMPLMSPHQIMDLEFARSPSSNKNAGSDTDQIPQDDASASKDEKDQSDSAYRQRTTKSDRKTPPSSSPITAEERLSPTVTSIYAAGSSSAALTSTGDLYTWGCDNANHLGLVIPEVSAIPNIEPGQRMTSVSRIQDSRSFDSRLNVLLPRRVDVLNQVGLKVESVAMSPNFVVTLCSETLNDTPEEDSLTRNSKCQVEN